MTPPRITDWRAEHAPEFEREILAWLLPQLDGQPAGPRPQYRTFPSGQ